jgi:hypothetical protein
MELLAVLGQYLLLTFVLPGFCYLLAFDLCFPGAFRRMIAEVPLGGAPDISSGWRLALAGMIGGLLLSSVAFALELALRYVPFFDKTWFPGIDFGKLPDVAEPSLASLFAAMAFMHFNIAVGILIILIALVLCAGYAVLCGGPAPAKPPAQPACLWAEPRTWFAMGLAVVVIANVAVASHLFRRVDCMVRTKESRVSVPLCMSMPSRSLF